MAIELESLERDLAFLSFDSANNTIGKAKKIPTRAVRETELRSREARIDRIEAVKNTSQTRAEDETLHGDFYRPGQQYRYSNTPHTHGGDRDLRGDSYRPQYSRKHRRLGVEANNLRQQPEDLVAEITTSRRVKTRSRDARPPFVETDDFIRLEQLDDNPGNKKHYDLEVRKCDIPKANVAEMLFRVSSSSSHAQLPLPETLFHA